MPSKKLPAYKRALNKKFMHQEFNFLHSPPPPPPPPPNSGSQTIACRYHLLTCLREIKELEH